MTVGFRDKALGIKVLGCGFGGGGQNVSGTWA